MRKSFVVLTAAASVAGCSPAPATPVQTEELRTQVMETERAFAATMTDRDHAAFTSFLSEEAIFFSGPEPVRGREAVAADWQRFFEGPTGPFSWEPETVEVLPSGALALSTGPVYDPAGNLVSRFSSIWRREPSGEWKIVFDRGEPVCNCEPVPAQ